MALKNKLSLWINYWVSLVLLSVISFTCLEDDQESINEFEDKLEISEIVNVQAENKDSKNQNISESLGTFLLLIFINSIKEIELKRNWISNKNNKVTSSGFFDQIRKAAGIIL